MKFFIFLIYRGMVTEIHERDDLTLAKMKFTALCEEQGRLKIEKEEMAAGFVRLNTMSAVQLFIVK